MVVAWFNIGGLGADTGMAQSSTRNPDGNGISSTFLCANAKPATCYCACEAGKRIKEVIRVFQTDANLKQGDGSSDRRADYCFAEWCEDGRSMVLMGIPWHDGRRGGRCPAVNLDRVIELRDLTRERPVDSAKLDEWLMTRRKERFTPILKEALAVMLSPEIATEEEASLAEDSSRAGDWASGWLRAHGMCLKRAEGL
jgi:hypothetical protein